MLGDDIKSVLVTGAAGFIGSHVCEKLLNSGCEVTGIDNLDPYYPIILKKRNLDEISATAEKNGKSFRFIEGDINDPEKTDEACRGVDLIIHLAAKAGVRSSMKNPLEYIKVNVEGTYNLLSAAKKAGIKKAVVASSSSVYGANKKIPFAESDPTDTPISYYAATKKSTEHICNIFCRTEQIDITCLRFFTAYGPRQRPEMAIALFTSLIDSGEPIPFFGDGDTERDYTYIDDIVEGVILAAQKTGGFRIYNLGESQTVSLNQLVETIENELGKKADRDIKPIPEGDLLKTCADIELAGRELGYRPTTSIKQGVKNYVAWYKDQPDRARVGK